MRNNEQSTAGHISTNGVKIIHHNVNGHTYVLNVPSIKPTIRDMAIVGQWFSSLPPKVQS